MSVVADALRTKSYCGLQEPHYKTNSPYLFTRGGGGGVGWGGALCLQKILGRTLIHNIIVEDFSPPPPPPEFISEIMRSYKRF